MSPSELKYQIEQEGSNPYFFTRKTMAFFGDTMRNYGVRSSTINGVECWELYRKRPVKHGMQSSHYFSKETFKTVHENK